MDLSIIIPVYNTEPKDLDRCFDSLRLSESITFEVILVDDGSGDETALFCQNYAVMHPIFRYVQQENRGVSAARNAGLSYAQGRYVMFVDADDALISDVIQRGHIDNGNDIVFYDHEVWEDNHTYRVRIFDGTRSVVLNKKDFIRAACQDKMNSSWARLYRRKMLMDCGIKFDEEMVVAEDAAFVLEVILAAEIICYVPISVYRYYHSYENGNNRIMRYPKVVFDNAVCLYQMRNDALIRHGKIVAFTAAELKKLHADIADRLVRALFEATGLLLVRGNAYLEMKDMVISMTKEIYQIYGKSFLPVTRLKCFLLKKDWETVIKAYACLRETYIWLKARSM